MKKFLTVLLVIAVMFTFSFGSAFAAMDLSTVVETKAEAVKYITDKADGFIADITTDLNKLISEYETNKTNAGDVSKKAYEAVLKEAAEKATSEMKTAKVTALNELEEAEKAVAAQGSILGYMVKDGTPEAGYVNVYTILQKITDPAFDQYSFTDAGNLRAFAVKEFDLVKEDTLKAIQAVNPADYSTTDKASGDKSSYQVAAETKSAALAAVNAVKVADTDTDAAAVKVKIQSITDIFKIENKGTAAEAYAGTEGSKLANLKKTTTELTDTKKAEYAKSEALAKVKSVIESTKADLIKEQKDKIFAQEVSSKPDQKVIDAANKKIDEITKQYDALLEVYTYRLTNAKYEVLDKTGYVNATYNDVSFLYLGAFPANIFDINPALTTISGLIGTLSIEKAVAIAEYVDELEKKAESLNGTIEVDGNVYVNVEEALAKAVEKVYMTGDLTVRLAPTTANYEAHDRVHELLGATGTKVTVDKQKYDTVYAWDDKLVAYDDAKQEEIEDLIDETEEALKATNTVAEADAAFLAAYAKFDAIPTDAEHDAMFVYGGALYDAYTKAVAEVSAYVSYKAEVMGDIYPGSSTTTLKDYYTAGNGKGVLWDDVYSLEDLNAKVAEAKATIDGLKTKKELTDQESALNAKLVDVKVPVTLDAKDSIVALYKDIKDFIKYCDMVGYTEGITLAGLPTTYVEKVAELEKDAMDDIVDKIYADGKITLEDKADVEALAAAAKAYKELYVEELEVAGITEAEFTYVGKVSSVKASYFEDEIFKLEVDAAEALLKALPANGATASQIKAAKDAVEALGFDGICELDRDLLAKLNRLDQNLMFDVESLKITASSKAAKGSMTINWKVKGNATGVEAFEIWKSTKKSSGFKKSFTTTNGEKRSYKNTKELKKGTRYYYKVRAIAYDMNGKKITSDWSNKAYRIAK